MDQPPKLLDRLPQLPPRPSSKSNLTSASSAGKEAAAKKRLMARLEAMGVDALEPPAVDPRTAAVAALMVANFVSDDAIRARFQPLANARLFDLNALEDLPVAARFVLRILPKLGLELEQRPVPTKELLVDQVKLTKGDMLRLAERYLGDTDEAHGRIVTIRMADGVADDLHDLRMLADLWRDYGETLALGAGAAYRSEAEKEARELAMHLEIAYLGPLSDEDKEWRSYLHRSLAMLVPLYNEVCRAGRFLFHDDKPEARFPTLASVARVRRRLRREATRRADGVPSERMSTPYPGTPKSIPPEISLVDVSAGHEEALAEAMVEVPPSGPLSLTSRTSTSSDAPMPGLPLSRPPLAPTPSNAPVPGPVPIPETLSFDASEPARQGESSQTTRDGALLEVVRLDFSPETSAGEDADANLDTADLDLELDDTSESNFYSDLAGQNVGLFIATFVVKPPGTPIAVRLSIPQLRAPILVSGTVHWVREFSPSIEAPPGMGIALQPLRPEHERAVDTFMRVRPAILHDM
jgi:hypothetical protein